MSNDVQTVNTDIQTVKSDIQTAKTDIQTVNTDVQTAKTDIQTIKTDVQAMQIDVQNDFQRVKQDVQDVQHGVQNVQTNLQGVKHKLEETQKVNFDNCKKMKDDVQNLQKDVDVVKDDLKNVKNKLDEVHKISVTLDKTKETQRHPRIEDLVENTKLILESNKKNLYVPQEQAEKEALQRLLKHRIITISGRGGCGKTSLGKQLMVKFCDNHKETDKELQYTPVIVSRPEDFELIKGTDHLVVFIDDPFGKTNSNNTALLEWEKQFDKISSFCSGTANGNVCIIFGIRTSIMKECDNAVRKFDLFHEDKRVDLLSKFKLKSSEKMKILQAYCDKFEIDIYDTEKEEFLTSHPVCSDEKLPPRPSSSLSLRHTPITMSSLIKISNTDPFIGFLQSCNLFFSSEVLFHQGIDFFKHADESLLRGICLLKEDHCLQYIILVYMLLEGGEIDLNAINEHKIQELYKCVKKEYKLPDIKDCVQYRISKVYIEKVESVTQYENYIEQTHNTMKYQFTHETILEAVLLSFCDRHPELFLQLSCDRIVHEFGRPSGYLPEPGEICVKVTPSCHKLLAEKLVFGGFPSFRETYDATFIEDLLVALEKDVCKNMYTKYSVLLQFFKTDEALAGARTIDQIFTLGLQWAINYKMSHLIKPMCSRYSNYKQVLTDDPTSLVQTDTKPRISVESFLHALNCLLEMENDDEVEQLLQSSGLDLNCIYNSGKKGCADQIKVRSTYLGYDKLLIPICYAAEQKFKNLVMFLMDKCPRLAFNDNVEQLLEQCCRHNWTDVLEKLLVKTKEVLDHKSDAVSRLPLLAAKCKSQDVVLHLLKYDIKISATDMYGKDLLHYCCENDWTDVTEIVLKGANVHPVDLQSNVLSNAILYAARCRSKAMVQFLLEFDVNITTTDSHGNHLLHYCCENDWADITDSLLRRRSSHDDYSLSSLILKAAKNKKKDTVLCMLKYDIDITETDFSGCHLLYYCCVNDWVDIVDMILQEKKDALCRKDHLTSTLILIAASHRYKSLVLCLLKYNADITGTDVEGKNLLQFCCQNDWADVTDRILELKRDALYIPGHSASSLILHAAKHRSKNHVLYLLKHNVDITVADIDGHHLLYYCCRNNWVDVVETILEKKKGTLPHIGYLTTLVDLAARCGHKDMVVYLLRYDVDITSVVSLGRNLLQHCCSNRWIDVLEKIREKYGTRDFTFSLLYPLYNGKDIVLYLLQANVDIMADDASVKTLLNDCCERDWVDVVEHILEIKKDVLQQKEYSPSSLALHAAQLRGKDVVLYLLQFHVDITATDSLGNDLVYYCCKNDWPEVMERIKGVFRKKSSSTVILNAANFKSKRMVWYLLKYDVDIKSTDASGYNLIDYCCKNDWVDIIERLIEKRKLTINVHLLPSLMIQAAKYKSKGLVNHFLRYDMGVIASDEYRNHLLNYCCRYNWVDITQKLLEENKDYESFPPTHSLFLTNMVMKAAACGSKDMVLYLMNHDVDLWATDVSGEYLVQYCCKKNWLDITQKVLQKSRGVPHQKKELLTTLIIQSAKKGNEDMVLCFLNYMYTAKMNLANDAFTSQLLYHCCERGFFKVVNMLLGLRRDAHHMHDPLPTSLILHAAKRHSKEMVTLLLKYDFDVTDTDSFVSQLLRLCCEKGWEDVIEMILRKYSNTLHCKDATLSVLILHAAKNKKKSMVLHLLQHDVNITKTDRFGYNLLHYCCSNDWVDVAERLLRKRKDIFEHKDHSRSHFILYAAMCGRKNMMMYLLKSVDSDVTLGVIDQLLYYCCQHDWVSIIDILLHRGNDGLELKDNMLPSLITHAAKYGKLEMVNYFCRYNVDFTATHLCRNLLHYCCKYNWVTVAWTILEVHKGIRFCSPSDLILQAAKCKNQEMVVFLLKYNIDITTVDSSGNHLLNYCCKHGWTNIVEKLMETNKDVLQQLHQKDNSNNTPILHAAKCRNSSLVLYLLEYIQDIADTDESWNSLLFYCLKNDWSDIVQKNFEKFKSFPHQGIPSLLLHAAMYKRKHCVLRLLEDKVKISETDTSGKHLLNYCCEYDWVDVAQKAFETCEGPSFKIEQTLTSLILSSAKFKSKNMVLYLLNCPVDLTAVDTSGHHLLSYCCKNIHWIDIAERVLKKNKNALYLEGHSPSTLTLLAAECRHKEMVMYLLKYHVDISVTDTSGHHLLHYCCQNNWIDVIETIFEKNKNVSDRLSSDLILHSAKVERENLVSYFMTYKCDFTLADSCGNNLLHYCAKYGWEEEVVRIIEINPELVSSRNENGVSPLLIAVEFNRKGVVLKLLQHGADMTMTDTHGNTILHYCGANDWEDIIQIVHTNTDLISHKNKKGFSPFHIALLYSNSKAISFFSEDGVESLHDKYTSVQLVCVGLVLSCFKNMCNTFSGLHVQQGMYKSMDVSRILSVVESLIKQNVDIVEGFCKPMDDHGYTILHYFVMQQCPNPSRYSLFDEYKDLLSFVMFNCRQASHVRNKTNLPTALHLTAYLGKYQYFVLLYEAGVRSNDGDLSIRETVQLGRRHCNAIWHADKGWNNDDDGECLLKASEFCLCVCFHSERDYDKIDDFCSLNSIIH